MQLKENEWIKLQTVYPSVQHSKVILNHPDWDWNQGQPPETNLTQTIQAKRNHIRIRRAKTHCQDHLQIKITTDRSPLTPWWEPSICLEVIHSQQYLFEAIYIENNQQKGQKREKKTIKDTILPELSHSPKNVFGPSAHFSCTGPVVF